MLELDILNTTYESVRGVVAVSPCGRAMVFQLGTAAPSVVVVKETGADVKSEDPRRAASRNPSRPAVELLIANGRGKKGIVTVEPNEVAEATLPLLVTADVDPRSTLPVPPLPPMVGAPVAPPMVIRTGGRK